MRLELAQTYVVGSDASNGRKPPICVRQDKTVPTLHLATSHYSFRYSAELML